MEEKMIRRENNNQYFGFYFKICIMDFDGAKGWKKLF